MQPVCLKRIFMPQYCVNSLKSEVLRGTQGASQNVIARTHLDIFVVQRLVYKGGKIIDCVLGCTEKTNKLQSLVHN